MTTKARELTDREQQDRHEVCHGLNEQVKAALVQGRHALWTLAGRLHEFDEASAWAPLGYDSLTHWLADPEITMTSSTYYRLIRAWRTLVVVRRMELPAVHDLDLSKVDIVIPAIEAGRVTVEEALADARQMGARDLREEYAGQKAASPPGGASGDGGAQAPPSAPSVDVTLEAWRSLRDELIGAAVSGGAQPRIRGELVSPGLDALRRLVAVVDEGLAGVLVEEFV